MKDTAASDCSPLTQGSVYKRCQCTVRLDGEGKRTTCPCDGGSWYFAVDAGCKADGRRNLVRRGGFRSREEATQAARERLAIVPPDSAPWRSQAYRQAAAAMLAEDLPRLALSGDGPTFVYIILAAGHVKVGHSKDPVDRLGSVKRSTPQRLLLPEDVALTAAELWWAYPGTREDERQLQHLARNYWVRGEWYQADPQLLKALTVLRERHTTEVYGAAA